MKFSFLTVICIGDDAGYDYTWTRRDGRLPRNSRTDDYKLYIDRIRREDQGDYVCKARARTNNQELERPVSVVVIPAIRKYQKLIKRSRIQITPLNALRQNFDNRAGDHPRTLQV